jgi:cytochrome P450
MHKVVYSFKGKVRLIKKAFTPKSKERLAAAERYIGKRAAKNWFNDLVGTFAAPTPEQQGSHLLNVILPSRPRTDKWFGR